MVSRGPLRDALERAGLQLASLEPVRPGGSVWRATGPQGAWSVRWAPRSEAAALAATALWLERSTAAGLAVPNPWRANATPTHLVTAGEGVALVTRWRRGTSVLELGWDEARAEALGMLLARTHLVDAGAPLAGARRYDGAWASGAWPRLAIERAVPAATAEERATVREGLRRAAAVLDASWHGGPGGPVVMAHADVHAGNVLEIARAGDRVELALIDVDRVGLAPVALDLAFALLEHDQPTAWALLRGYRRWRPLDAGFEASLSAFRVLAIADNLGFLAAFERERAFVAAAWPTLVAASSALAAASPVGGTATGARRTASR